VGPDIWFLEDLAGYDEAEDLIEPDGMQSGVAPERSTPAPSDEVEKAGHKRTSDTLVLERRLGGHPPQSPRRRSACIMRLTDQGDHADDRTSGIEGREVGARLIAFETDLEDALMRSENSLPKWQHEMDRNLLDVDVHGRGLYRQRRHTPRGRRRRW
jgi:hypothetical protein